MDHYFTNNTNIKSNRRDFYKKIDEIELKFTTDHGVFSYDDIDYGTELLIKTIFEDENINEYNHAIDLGCGYGPIGLFIKRKFSNLSFKLVDINERAVELTKHNAKENDIEVEVIKSDFFKLINEENYFNLIVSNPPIRIGKQILFKMYDEAYNKLTNNGTLWLVVRKQQGALSHLKFLETVFEDVQVKARSKGFFIISARKII